MIDKSILDDIKLQALKARYEVACSELLTIITECNELKSEIFRLEAIKDSDIDEEKTDNL
jgi:hypothetical protein